MAWIVIGAYVAFALWHSVTLGRAWRPLQLTCRMAHAAILTMNCILSDKLHNLDLHLGAEYRKRAHVRSTTELEQRIHAQDWGVALSVPASYHLMLILGIMPSERVATTDVALLTANLVAFGLMVWRIAPARITPKRELFLAFVLTFAAQMVLLLAAFWRERLHHPWWLAVWGVYALGLVFKGLEWPESPSFGHHEILHASCIIGHAAGLIVDAATS